MLGDKYKEYFESCLKMRIEELCHTFLDNETYKETRLAQVALYQEIREALPEDLKDKIVQYYEYQIILSGIEHRTVFRDGFSCGCKLVEFILESRQAPPLASE